MPCRAAPRRVPRARLVLAQAVAQLEQDMARSVALLRAELQANADELAAARHSLATRARRPSGPLARPCPPRTAPGRCSTLSPRQARYY